MRHLASVSLLLALLALAATPALGWTLFGGATSGPKREGAFCDSSRVRMTFLPGPRVCGSPFQVFVNSTRDEPECPFSPGGMGGGGGAVGAIVCDANRQNCVPCLSVEQEPDGTGLLYTCQPTQFNGVQIAWAGYRYGHLDGSISVADVFSGCSNAPVVTPPSPDCRSSNVQLTLLPGPRDCLTPIQALLNQTVVNPNCLLSPSGIVEDHQPSGAAVCDANRQNCVDCVSFIPTLDRSSIIFVCPPTQFSGVQVVTIQYYYGPLHGSISTSDSFVCPLECNLPVSPPVQMPCGLANVSFGFPGISPEAPCDKGIAAVLRTTTDECSLSSGGALICDSQGRNCQACDITSSTETTVWYHCPTSAHPFGTQIATSTFQIGQVIGTLSDSITWCPYPPPPELLFK